MRLLHLRRVAARGGPAVDDLRMRDGLLDARGPDLLEIHGPARDHRRGHLEHAVTHDGGIAPVTVGAQIAEVGMLVDPQALDGTLHVGADETEVRAGVVDHGAVRAAAIVDVRHVDRVLEDDQISRWRQDDLGEHGRAELADADEAIVLRADVVILVDRRRVTVIHGLDVVVIHAHGLAGAFRPGRQRRPADVIVVGPPGDPARPPLVAGHPGPADALQPRPASVMVGCPAERLVGYPGPAVVGLRPIAVRVGTPVIVAVRDGGVPHVAEVRGVVPVAVVGEAVVEQVEGGFLRAGVARRQGCQQRRQEQGQQGGGFHWGGLRLNGECSTLDRAKVRLFT